MEQTSKAAQPYMQIQAAVLAALALPAPLQYYNIFINIFQYYIDSGQHTILSSVINTERSQVSCAQCAAPDQHYKAVLSYMTP